VQADGPESDRDEVPPAGGDGSCPAPPAARLPKRSGSRTAFGDVSFEVGRGQGLGFPGLNATAFLATGP
jgi:hypothetical protein